MKVPITVSLCISKDFEIEITDITEENLYDAFMLQKGLPLNVYDYPTDDGWCVDDMVINNNLTD